MNVTPKELAAITAALTVAVFGLSACEGSQHDGTQTSSTTVHGASTLPSTAAPSTAAQGQDDQLALQILDAIVRGDFSSATEHFDSDMKQKLTPDGLGSAWGQYQQAFGTYQSHGSPEDVPRGDLTVVNVPLQMEKMPGQFRVTFHPDATVAGLWFLKTGVPVP